MDFTVHLLILLLVICLQEFALVDPTDQSRFPGVTSIQRRFASWDWVFAKSPPFSITRTFAKSVEDSGAQYSEYSMRTKIVIEKGKVKSVSVELSGRPRGSSQPVALASRLLAVVEVEGAVLEEGRLARLWEGCWRRVRETEGEEDHELLVWGLQCLILCLPVGRGDLIEN